MAGLIEEQQSLFDWIDTQHDRMVETVLAWSRINSGSYNAAGVRKMAATIGEALAPLGGEAETLPVAPLQTVNHKGEVKDIPLGDVLRIRKRPDAPVKIVLSGHLDTVFPENSHFQEPVWLDDNTINGPGVSDLKGGLVCMMVALEALEKSPYAEKVSWEILLNPDEEIGSQGSNPFLVEAAKNNHFGLIYEPMQEDGTMVSERKGSGNFTFVAHGKAAHAGRAFDEGRNAVALLSELIVKLYALNGRREGVTINPAKLEGGGPSNVVPELALVRFNVRLLKADDAEWLQQHFDALVEEFSAREGFNLELHGAFTRPPKIISPEQQALMDIVEQCGNQLGQKISYKPTGGCCDGNNMAAAGLPNIDTMGVRGGRIHSDEEFIKVDSLTERAKLSAAVLLTLANQAEG